MTADKLAGIVRAVAAPFIAYAAAKGWLVDNQTGELVIVALSAVATAVWSVWSKNR